MTAAVTTTSTTQHRTPVTGAEIVVLDEKSRWRDLYGSAFELLGISPREGNNCTHEEILANSPRLILLSREWSYDWRLVAAGARRANIPVIYMMDGVLEWSYVWNNLSFVRGEGTVLQPLIASHLCVAGKHPARLLAGLGMAPRIHVTGLPRYDGFDSSRIVDSNRPRKILICTAKTFGHNVEQLVYVRRALRDLKLWFAENNVAEPVWRIAPELAEELEVCVSANGTLMEQLNSIDALISFPSTCVLEAMLKGIPTAQIDYRAVPMYVSSAWEIRARDHIGPVVQELLYPPAIRLGFQRNCLEDELEPGSASQRLATVIQSALADPSPYSGAEHEGNRSGLLDFRQIHSELSAFALSDKSVLQYELDAAYGLIKRYKRERDAALTRTLQPAAEVSGPLAQLEKLASDRLQTIQHLDSVARDRQATIERLNGMLRAAHSRLQLLQDTRPKNGTTSVNRNTAGSPKGQ